MRHGRYKSNVRRRLRLAGGPPGPGGKTAKKASPSSEHKREKAARPASRAGGVTLAELATKMVCELHTTRGVISVLGSKHGIKIESFKNGAGERTYRIK